MRLLMTFRLIMSALGWALAASCSEPAPAQEVVADAQARLLLWQTNAAGNDIHIFDADSGALVRRLEVGPHPHGLAATTDHRTVFVTLEANGAPRGELVWIDAATFEITRRVSLCREPHALAASPDGAWLYVPCRDGHYWIVDGRTGEVARRIRTGGRPHNTQVSADGRFAFLSPMGAGHTVTVLDIARGNEPVGEIVFADSVRPSALSREFLLQHVDGLNGFQVADLGSREIIATIEHSTPLSGVTLARSLGRLSWRGFERCHGLAITPDQQEVWSVCTGTVTVHGLQPPDFSERSLVMLPSNGYWITFSPDGSRAFVALSNSGRVAVINARTREIVRVLTAGRAPKRNLVLRVAASPALNG